MKSIHLDHSGTRLDFPHARLLAQEAARQDQMREPTIMAWHAHYSDAVSPAFDGGNPGGWWEKFGEGNGGRLHIDVGDDYQFVVMDAGGFESLGPMPVRNLRGGDGVEYVCMTAMLGTANTPNQQACMPLDDWWADQY